MDEHNNTVVRLKEIINYLKDKCIEALEDPNSLLRNYCDTVIQMQEDILQLDFDWENLFPYWYEQLTYRINLSSEGLVPYFNNIGGLVTISARKAYSYKYAPGYAEIRDPEYGKTTRGYFPRIAIDYSIRTFYREWIWILRKAVELVSPPQYIF